MTSVLDAIVGRQQPRIECIPEGEEHPDADAVIELAEACGIALDEWQEYALRESLRRRAGLWAAFAVAVCAPRQNGKNGITEVRELAGPLILGEDLVIHSAHLADTSKEAFRRLDMVIDANEWLSREVRHIWRTNGHEAIEFKSGRRIRFRTRTKGGGRGFSGDLVVFDEAMYLSEIQMGAILPVVSARPDPQIWYAGSAVDQSIHDEGGAFARVRRRALAGEDERLAYFEWSADADHPDEVTDEMAGDPEVWAAANPALGIRIDPSYVADERRELSARTFAVERLGVGDWPDGLRGRASIISRERWDELVDPQSRVNDPVTFGFDVAPDRSWASVAAGGFRPDGLPHVEIAERKRGTGWVVNWIAERVQKHRASGVVCDASGPASSLIVALEAAGIPVVTVTAKEYAQACGHLYDQVDQGRLRHLGSAELANAVAGAATRPLGDAWAWSRKSSSVDITPLVAATLALWGAHQPVEKSSGWKAV